MPNFSKYSEQLDREINSACRNALLEDLGGEGNEDITASLIDINKEATAKLISRESGVVCGQKWFDEIFRLLGSDVEITWHKNDGDICQTNDIICQLSGNARKILTGERSAMNFLQTLSSTATVTHQYAAKIKHTKCQLLDTRKTIPGMRFGQKYAVACGGGTNHRLGLHDAYLIKENHIISCGGIGQALSLAISQHPDKLLEIEVENLNELHQALDGMAQVIMLDNFSLTDMQEAIRIRNSHSNQAKLEASGNICIDSIAEVAETGVDYISVGALTKNIKALDLSMRIDLQE